MKLSSIYLIAASLAAIAGTATAAPADHLREGQRIKGPPARADSLPVVGTVNPLSLDVHPGPAKQSAVEHPLNRRGAIHRRADSLPLVGTVNPLDRNVQLGPARQPVLVEHHKVVYPSRGSVHGQPHAVEDSTHGPHGPPHASRAGSPTAARPGPPGGRGVRRRPVPTESLGDHRHHRVAAAAAAAAKLSLETAKHANVQGWGAYGKALEDDASRLKTMSNAYEEAAGSTKRTNLKVSQDEDIIKEKVYEANFLKHGFHTPSLVTKKG